MSSSVLTKECWSRSAHHSLVHEMFVISLWTVCSENGAWTCGRWDIIYENEDNTKKNCVQVVQVWRRLATKCSSPLRRAVKTSWPSTQGMKCWYASHTFCSLYCCPLGFSFCCHLCLVMYYFIVVWSSWHWNPVGVIFNVLSTAKVMWLCECVAVLIITPCINCESFIHVGAKQKASN